MKSFIFSILFLSTILLANADNKSLCTLTISDHLPTLIGSTFTIKNTEYLLDNRVCSVIDSNDSSAILNKLFSGSDYLQSFLTELNNSYSEESPILTHDIQFKYFPELGIVRIGIRKPIKRLSCTSPTLIEPVYNYLYTHSLTETYLPALGNLNYYDFSAYQSYVLSNHQVSEQLYVMPNIDFIVEDHVIVTRIIDNNKKYTIVNRGWRHYKSEHYRYQNKTTPITQKPKNIRPEGHYIYIYDNISDEGNVDISYQFDFIRPHLPYCSPSKHEELIISFSDYFDLPNDNNNTPNNETPNNELPSTWLVPLTTGIF